MFPPVPDEWEENFQDLSGWCLPTTSVTKTQCIADPAELNTPVLELGCEELQLNINVSKAEPNFVQDTEKKIGFWPPLDEPSFMNLWFPKNNYSSASVEITDSLVSADSEKNVLNEPGSDFLGGQDGSASLANWGRNFPKSSVNNTEEKMNISVDSKTSTKASTPKPKLKLNIPGSTVFNENDLSTPNIVRMLIESPTINVKKPTIILPVELNSFDGSDDSLQPLVELGGEFDLLAYMSEESTRAEQTDVDVEAVCESGVIADEYVGINELRSKLAHTNEQCVKPDGISWKASDADIPSTSKESDSKCKNDLLQFTLPINTLIKEEVPSSEEDESYFLELQTKKRKLKKTSTKSMTIPSKRSRRSISSSSMSNLSDGTSDHKYRELRDRNNEASKRSRRNRKVRDGEMSREALRLEKENRSLKIKAEEMERLVKQLRESLLKTIAKPK